jgi:hypothetical protein
MLTKNSPVSSESNFGDGPAASDITPGKVFKSHTPTQ